MICPLGKKYSPANPRAGSQVLPGGVPLSLLMAREYSRVVVDAIPGELER